MADVAATGCIALSSISALPLAESPVAPMAPMATRATATVLLAMARPIRSFTVLTLVLGAVRAVYEGWDHGAADRFTRLARGGPAGPGDAILLSRRVIPYGRPLVHLSGGLGAPAEAAGEASSEPARASQNTEHRAVRVIARTRLHSPQGSGNGVLTSGRRPATLRRAGVPGAPNFSAGSRTLHAGQGCPATLTGWGEASAREPGSGLRVVTHGVCACVCHSHSVCAAIGGPCVCRDCGCDFGL